MPPDFVGAPVDLPVPPPDPTGLEMVDGAVVTPDVVGSLLPLPADPVVGAVVTVLLMVDGAVVEPKVELPEPGPGALDVGSPEGLPKSVLPTYDPPGEMVASGSVVSVGLASFPLVQADSVSARAASDATTGVSPAVVVRFVLRIRTFPPARVRSTTIFAHPSDPRRHLSTICVAGAASAAA
jgi:hypothetical protein